MSSLHVVADVMWFVVYICNKRWHSHAKCVSYFEHDLSNKHYSIFILQPAAQGLAVRGLYLYFGGVWWI